MPLVPRAVSAATCSAPSVTGITVGGVQQHHGPAGSTVQLNGSGFAPFGCTVQSVAVNGVSVPSFTVVSDSVITFKSAPGMSGQVAVTLADSLGGTVQNSAPNMNYVTDPTVSGLDNATPTTGATVHLLGQGFQLNVGGSGTTASYAWAAGPSNGSGCSGASSSATVADDSHITLVAPSQYCDGSVVVTFRFPNDTSNSSYTMLTVPASPASAPFDIAANPTGMSRTSAVPGQTVTVSGTGFGNQGGTATLNGQSATVQSWNDSTVTALVPSTATSGALTFTRKVDGKSFSAPQNLTVSGAVSSVSPAQGAVGDTITVNGAGFGVQSGTVSVAGTAATVQSWSPSSIAFTVPDGVPPGGTTLAITTNGTSAPSPPAFTVIPRITGMTPAHAPAGSVVEVDGTTFGTQQGMVQVGGQDATVQIWGDKSVVVALPAGLSPGDTTVSLTPAATSAAATYPYSIDNPPPSGSSGGSGSGSGTGGPGASSGSGGSGGGHASPVPGTPGAQEAPNGLILPSASGPIIAHGPVQFSKPSPPPGPVSLRLDAKDSQSDPATDVPFTVTLLAFGKPVVGAPVDLLLVIEPGGDASLNPAHGVTDAQGRVTGVIHLSRTPGDHIVLARSGIYSDEVRVVGRGANATVASGRVGAESGSPTPSLVSVRSPVLWALVACILLFGAGFGLNLVTAPAYAGAGTAAAKGGRERSAREALGDITAAAAAIARYGASLVAVAGALALGALRRRG